MYKLSIYVPENEKENLKKSLFKAKAGKYKNYDKCCWETKGTGQFRPLPGSNPYIGKHNTLKKVREFKIEIIFENILLDKIIEVIKNTHPYEEPAYQIIKLIKP